MEPFQQKHLLIDGDILVRRAAEIAVKTEYLFTNYKDFYKIYSSHADLMEGKKLYGESPEVWIREVDQGIDFAKMVLDNSLTAICNRLQPSGTTTYISGRDCFRYKVATTRLYKVTREIHGKPKHYRELLNYFGDKYGYKLTDGIEADDAIGIASTGCGEGCVICSIDKDLDQLAGWHYDWVKDRIYRVSQKQADFNLYRQILSGDSVDGIPGLHGVGPKTAEKILSDSQSTQDLFQATWSAYRDRAGDVPDQSKWDYFREQAKLIYVLRTEKDEESIIEDYDHFWNLPGCRNLWQIVDSSEVKPNLTSPNGSVATG